MEITPQKWLDSQMQITPEIYITVIHFPSSIIIRHGAPIFWCSKQQRCPVLSTTEAEFVALTEAAKEAIWLKRLISEISLENNEKPLSLFSDNQSAIKLNQPHFLD